VNRPAPAPQGYAPSARTPAQARAWHREGNWRRDAWGPHDNWQQHRSEHWDTDHRGWAQRGGYGGYYIPRNRFQRSFGPDHFFRLHARPTIYDGYPRFYYGGYYFTIVDPWPGYWGDAWYDSDELFVSWDGDGYYLHDRRYPDMALAVTVNL